MPESRAPGGARARATSRSLPVERGRGPPKTSAKDAKRRVALNWGRSIPSPLLARRRGAGFRGTRVRRGSCGRRAIRWRRRSSRVAGWRGSRIARRRRALLGRWERVRRRSCTRRLLLRARRDQQERSHAQEQSTAIHRVTSLFGLRFPAHGGDPGRSVVTRMAVKRSDVAFRVRSMAEMERRLQKNCLLLCARRKAWLEAPS